MPKIYLVVEQMNETKSRTINLSHRVQSLENEIARSINRLDWEVSQKQLIREQISLAKTKANQVAHKANLLGSFIQKAINDFTAADLRCANQQKELNNKMDRIWKGLMWLDSKIHSAVKTTVASILNFVKQAELIFLNRMNQLKTTNLNIIYSAMGFIAVGAAKISPIQLPDYIRNRIQVLPFKPTPEQGTNSVAPQQTSANEQVPPLHETLSVNPSVYSEDVKVMQRRLNELGYRGADGKPLVEDGRFGNNTLVAVNQFKANNHLDNAGPYEGKVGATSWPVLFSAAAIGAQVGDTQINNNTSSNSSEASYTNGTKEWVVQTERGQIHWTITDEEFLDSNALSQNQITNILNQKNPGLVERGFDKAIFEYAQRKHINPKVILATLAQEQSWCKTGNYDKAFGVGPGGNPMSFAENEKGGLARSVNTYLEHFNTSKAKLDNGQQLQALHVNYDPNKHETIAVVGKNRIDLWRNSNPNDAKFLDSGEYITPVNAAMYAKLRYTPWTNFPPQNSTPLQTWHDLFRSF